VHGKDTPAKLPTLTDVDRSRVSQELRRWTRRGGFFISVLGTTKLGKTTLVKTFIASLGGNAWSTYIPGQSLPEGAADLWRRLANELGIPTSKETGLANSDRTTWGIAGRLSAALFPGTGTSIEATTGGALEKSSSANESFDLDPELAVTDAFRLLREQGGTVVVAIDDFHFVTSETARRSVVLALRPLTDIGCSVILSTIPGGQTDVAFANTNLGGRRKSVRVPRWTEDELSQIATKGFPPLSVTATLDIVKRMAQESFGSPQIMQQLCLDLCEEVNHVEEGEPDQPLIELSAPANWGGFFRALEDDEAFDWVQKLAGGPNPRKKRKKQSHPGPPPRDLDGYQLIMLALHELGSPSEVKLSVIKQHIGDQLSISGTKLNNLALELKARNLDLLASRDTISALERQSESTGENNDAEDESELEEALFAELVAVEAIPQPVFEVRGERLQATVRILDPLLCYMLKWHPELIETARGS
jgi:hypothetical protein